MSEHDPQKGTIITPKPEPSELAGSEQQPEIQESIKVEEGPAIELQEPGLDSTGPWVKYNGVATLRIMDRNAWLSAGVDSDKYVEWNFLNNMRVPVSYFTEAELRYLLGRDGRFSKVDN